MQNCLDCGKVREWRRTGKTDERGAQIRKCGNCGREQAEPPSQGLKIPPSVLYFDIETALIKTSIFQPGRQYVSWKNMESETFVMCWAATWMGRGGVRVVSGCVTPQEAVDRDDSRCLKRLRNLMDRADYIVGHNMRAFDWKTVQDRFITLDIDPPHDSKIVDTLTLSRTRFKNISHSLDAWRRKFGYEPKQEMKREDWEKCLRGEEKALRKMRTYCAADVREGVKVELRFQKYIEKASGKLLFP